VRCPMPGRRDSSVTSRFTGGASTWSRLELHQEVLALHEVEAERLVQRMCVGRVERELAQPLEVRVRHHGTDEVFPKAAAAVLGQDEHVHQVGKRRAVGDHAGEADLLVVLVGAEAERVVDRAVDDLA
jgi:hypothetical protein